MTAPSWPAVTATLTVLAPVKVEPEPNGGRKLCIVSEVSGRLVAKLPANSASDKAIAEAVAASINVTARAAIETAAAKTGGGGSV